MSPKGLGERNGEGRHCIGLAGWVARVPGLVAGAQCPGVSPHDVALPEETHTAALGGWKGQVSAWRLPPEMLRLAPLHCLCPVGLLLPALAAAQLLYRYGPGDEGARAGDLGSTPGLVPTPRPRHRNHPLNTGKEMCPGGFSSLAGLVPFPLPGRL